MHIRIQPLSPLVVNLTDLERVCPLKQRIDNNCAEKVLHNNDIRVPTVPDVENLRNLVLIFIIMTTFHAYTS